MNERFQGGRVAWAALLMLMLTMAPVSGQPQQRVDVRIKDFTFITEQLPLQLNVPILITIRNEDMVRHDFGSSVFGGAMTHVETGGVITYGREVGGVFLDAQRSAAIRFTIDRPGRYEFRCSIHPEMKGELLMMNIGAV